MVKVSKYFSLLSLLWCLGFTTLKAQDKKRYLVYFKDKSNTPYSINEPEKFLSKRAIERRKRQNIAIDDKDLPINPTYVQQVRDKGARVWYETRWFNAVYVEADEKTMADLKSLPFVLPQTLYLTNNKVPSVKGKLAPSEQFLIKTPNDTKYSPLDIKTSEDYGDALNQNEMLGANQMHALGYRGQGMVIAVLDAGFSNGNRIPALSHLFKDKRILGTYDFVRGINEVYDADSHGLEVLSCMAGYEKGKMIGTAPEASYYLFRTEDAGTEYRVEEANWTVAIEKADSLGVDVVNSSLGYTDFTDKKMSYQYKDMDGKTSLCTKAATIAAQKGIMVVNSAGNEGNADWQFVGAPADADFIISVGATNRKGEKAGFSSFGPTYDKRIKPTLSAQGSPATVAKDNGNIGSNYGTSFSSPIMCGMVASFWQGFPQFSNQEIISILQESASLANKPDTLLGYGVPNFNRAYMIAEQRLVSGKSSKNGFHLLKNSTQLTLLFGKNYIDTKASIQIINMSGKVLQTHTFERVPSEFEWDKVKKVPNQNYIIRITQNKNTEDRRWLKNSLAK